jgi:WD40 repeat protein
MWRGSKYLLLLFWGMTCSNLSACTPPKGETDNIYTEKFSILSPANVTDVQDLDSLSYLGAGSVGGLGFRSSDGLLLAAYLGDGFLRGWDLSTKTMAFEHKLSLVSSTGLEFDVAGDYIIGPQYSQMRDDDYYMQEYIGGVGLWETTSGNLVLCLDSICNEPLGSENLQDIGAAIDPTGTKVVVFDHNVFLLIDIKTSNSSINLVNSPENIFGLTSWEPLGKSIFNRDGEKLYIARLLGTVNVSGGFPDLRELISKTSEVYMPVEAIALDSEDKHFARIQGGRLNVWQLGLFNNQLLYESEIPNGKLLSFDKSGDLLFVGTENTILILDIENQKLIKEIPAIDLSVIFISPDNRLVFWGDKNGIIHIWGIPVK